jgi:hypothetical protein
MGGNQLSEIAETVNPTQRSIALQKIINFNFCDRVPIKPFHTSNVPY